ncbi:aminodeoxychorismate synthase component I [Legionella worsleiensis]|uniref:aminodeoxychorismate synthase n=1 Tax=Legionella worsleiensis TaxID=45076 RepID=A0A0W1AJF3_9GAMM|nr:aminodeoxychorismate synthase component I [Legionella worsleiensis]KTD81417.1 para-aminobenzoate synthase, component I [Legionella worsleiensis]STY30098.1 para-aminobenzoate synthase, component I [Legionella worsleiensis]
MIKSVSMELNYSLFLQESYQKFCDLPGFVLLESTDKVRGRYDILSAYPYDRIVIKSNLTSEEGALAKLRELCSKPFEGNDLPFQGGAMGYVSYDFGAHLHHIQPKPQHSLSDVPLLDMGLYDWAIITDHHLKKVTLFAANRHTSTKEICKKIIQLWNEPASEASSYTVANDFVPLMTQQQYQNAFWAIHHDLSIGRAYQVNLTQPFHAGYTGNSWEIYRRITDKNPVPFSAFIRNKNHDVLSFSPERFLYYEKRGVLTSPIKGTSRRSADPAADEQLKNKLMACEKNRAENVMIVDLMRNDLGKIAKPGTVEVSALCEVQSFNSVHHLVSDIKALCREEINPFDVFLSCFPGGSITGAPKLEAMNIINEQEPYARGIYCGSIGYFSNHGRFDTNIAIRTITAKDNILHLAAGGGILIDSDCEDEYRECYTKIAAIIHGLK